MPARERGADTSCADPEQDDGVPLVALLGRAEAAFVAEFDRRMALTEFADLSLAHSRNVLRHLGRGPVRTMRIVDRCGVSKQAVSQQVGHLERNGYLIATVDPHDQRARLLELTERGRRAQREAQLLFTQIEREWAEQVGDDDLDRVRQTLDQLVRGSAPATGGTSRC